MRNRKSSWCGLIMLGVVTPCGGCIEGVNAGVQGGVEAAISAAIEAIVADALEPVIAPEE